MNAIPEMPRVTVGAVPDPLPPGLRVLDVREPVEWAYGHIEGAVHIPLQQLPARLDEVPEGRVLVVCKIGGRSAHAVNWLAAQGRDVTNLDGGMLGWASANRPMVAESGQPPRIV